METDGIVNSELVSKNIGWIYEVGREEPEIQGSGSSWYNVIRTRDEVEVFRLFKEKAYYNYILRSRKENGRIIRQYYNFRSKTWNED